MTIATIGRRTKNSDIIDQGFCGLADGIGTGDWAGGVHSFTVTVEPSRAFWYAFDNDFVSGLQSVGDLPHRADALARFYRANTHLVVLIDHCDLEVALQFGHRFLWNNERILHRVRYEPHFAKLSGPQHGVRIRKGHVIVNRTCFGIQVSIQRIKFSFSRIDLAVAENQIEIDAFEQGFALGCIRVARKEIGECTLAHSYVGFDRINLRHRRERTGCCRTHQIADLIIRESGQPVDWRNDFCVAKIELGLLNGCFVRFDVCFAGSRSRDGGVSFLIADHLFIEQIDRALLIRIGLCPIGLVFGLSSLGLSERSLERPRIDLEKEIAFLYKTAFLVIARDNVALHLRVDVGINETVQRRNPFEHARHIARLHRCHLNFGRSRTGLWRFARASCKQRTKNQCADSCDRK